jgi:hypothetical protein
VREGERDFFSWPCLPNANLGRSRERDSRWAVTMSLTFRPVSRRTKAGGGRRGRTASERPTERGREGEKEEEIMDIDEASC